MRPAMSKQWFLTWLLRTLFVLSFILTEVISLSALHSKDTTTVILREQVSDLRTQITKLQSAQKVQDEVATCRSTVTSEWVSALDDMLKRQAEAISIVFTNPLDRLALNEKQRQLIAALKTLDEADDHRRNVNVLCPPPGGTR